MTEYYRIRKALNLFNFNEVTSKLLNKWRMEKCNMVTGDYSEDVDDLLT